MIAFEFSEVLGRARRSEVPFRVTVANHCIGPAVEDQDRRLNAR